VSGYGNQELHNPHSSNTTEPAERISLRKRKAQKGRTNLLKKEKRKMLKKLKITRKKD
jgi:hypothetical protein